MPDTQQNPQAVRTILGRYDNVLKIIIFMQGALMLITAVLSVLAWQSLQTRDDRVEAEQRAQRVVQRELRSTNAKLAEQSYGACERGNLVRAWMRADTAYEIDKGGGFFVSNEDMARIYPINNCTATLSTGKPVPMPLGAQEAYVERLFPRTR